MNTLVKKMQLHESAVDTEVHFKNLTELKRHKCRKNVFYTVGIIIIVFLPALTMQGQYTDKQLLNPQGTSLDALKEKLKQPGNSSSSSSSSRSNNEPYGYIDGEAYWTQESYREADRSYRTVNGYRYDTREEADAVRSALREGRVYNNEIYRTKAAADAARAEDNRKAEEARIKEKLRVAARLAETKSMLEGYSPTPSIPDLNPVPTRNVQSRPPASAGRTSITDYKLTSETQADVQFPSRPPASITTYSLTSNVPTVADSKQYQDGEESPYISLVSETAISLVGIAGMEAKILAIPAANIWKENYRAYQDWKNYGIIPSTEDILYNAFWKDGKVPEEVLRSFVGGLIGKGINKGIMKVGKIQLVEYAEKYMGVKPVIAQKLVEADLKHFKTTGSATLTGWKEGKKWGEQIGKEMNKTK